MKKLFWLGCLVFFGLTSFSFCQAAIDTSDWAWFKDKNDGYKVKMPKGWFVRKFYYPEIYTGAAPLRYTTFNSANEKYYLQLGIKKKNQNLMTSFRTGIGVGELKSTKKAKLGQQRIWAKFWAYNNKTKEVFFNSDKNELNISGYCVFGNYQLSAMFEAGDNIQYDNINIKKKLYQYRVAKKILRSFQIL